MRKPTLILLLIYIPIMQTTAQRTIDVQGHRGCRGIMPENTVQGFIKALSLGVTTLEMDVVISKDKHVVVSHEPYFAHEISTSPSGEEIPKGTDNEHNIYQLTYDEIRQYDVGLRGHSGFPRQEKVDAYKPLLSEVIRKSEEYVAEHGLKRPIYNIEIKRNPEGDGIFNPPVDEFVQLVVERISDHAIADRVCVQSFDVESLQEVKRMAPELTLALLIANTNSFEKNIESLGFEPDVYSPFFGLVTEDLVKACRKRGMRVIPWTVNEEKDMRKMIELDVDGIITDYPEELIIILHQKEIIVK